MIRLLSRTFLPVYCFLHLVSPVCALDGMEVLAKAYAEKMKVQSAEYTFTSMRDSGTTTKAHLVLDGSKVFLDQQVLEKGVLLVGTSVDDETRIFDGAKMIKRNGMSIRTYSATAAWSYASPTQVAFQWLASAMKIGRDTERLSDWKLWRDFSSKVVEVSEEGGGIVRLRAENFPAAVDYLDVFFDSSKNFYPIKFDFYRDGICIVKGRCDVEMFQSDSGEDVAFPVTADYRSLSGPGSYDSRVSHKVDPVSVRINPHVNEAQFTLAALPKGKVFDVDAMNKRLGGTLDERIKSVFEVTGTPVERHQRSLDSIQQVDQRMLIMFGDPTDARVRRLMEIRHEDADFHKVSDDFRFIAIPTDGERKSAAKELSKILNENISEDRGRFLLVILDNTGIKLAAADGAFLADGDGLSKEKLISFLQNHMKQPLDARQLLNDAFKQAKAENKRVLVQETAPWCGPCVLLSRSLNKHRVWEKDYVWVKMDHRWTGAKEIMSELRKDAKGGIPWFAILDSDGEILTTSNSESDGENIGFPDSEPGIAHFKSMLESTRQKLTDHEISALIEGLKKSQ